jgi:hypothetical protein
MLSATSAGIASQRRRCFVSGGKARHLSTVSIQFITCNIGHSFPLRKNRSANIRRPKQRLEKRQPERTIALEESEDASCVALMSVCVAAHAPAIRGE